MLQNASVYPPHESKELQLSKYDISHTNQMTIDVQSHTNEALQNSIGKAAIWAINTTHAQNS